MAHYNAPTNARYTCPMIRHQTHRGCRNRTRLSSAAVLLATLTAFSAAGQPAVGSQAQTTVDPPPEEVAGNPVADPCFSGVSAPRGSSDMVAAERVCSDAIARLSYMAEPAEADRSALASAYNNRALARMRSGDLEGAAADLGEALVLKPDSWAIYLNRGNLQLARNEPQAALLDYDRAKQIAPQAGVATARNAVLAYRQLNDLASAEQSLRQSGLPGVSPPGADRRPVAAGSTEGLLNPRAGDTGAEPGSQHQ